MALNLNENTVVVLDSSKTFWKTRAQLKIVVVFHKLLSCLEVVTFDPACGVDYQRIYVDHKKILTKLNQESIRTSLAEKQEACDRSKKPMGNKEEVLTVIRNNLIGKYIVDRINQVVNATTGVTRIWLQPTFDDIVVTGKESNQIDVECEKPLLLVPYVHDIKTIATS